MARVTPSAPTVNMRPNGGCGSIRTKLLVDPYAVEMDRRYVYDGRLSARRGEGGDTAPLVPKAIGESSSATASEQTASSKLAG